LIKTYDLHFELVFNVLFIQT